VNQNIKPEIQIFISMSKLKTEMQQLKKTPLASRTGTSFSIMYIIVQNIILSQSYIVCECTSLKTTEGEKLINTYTINKNTSTNI